MPAERRSDRPARGRRCDDRRSALPAGPRHFEPARTRRLRGAAAAVLVVEPRPVCSATALSSLRDQLVQIGDALGDLGASPGARVELLLALGQRLALGFLQAREARARLVEPRRLGFELVALGRMSVMTRTRSLSCSASARACSLQLREGAPPASWRCAPSQRILAPRDHHRRRIAPHALHGGEQRGNLAVALRRASRAAAFPAPLELAAGGASIAVSWPSDLLDQPLRVSSSSRSLHARALGIDCDRPAALGAVLAWLRAVSSSWRFCAALRLLRRAGGDQRPGRGDRSHRDARRPREPRSRQPLGMTSACATLGRFLERGLSLSRTGRLHGPGRWQPETACSSNSMT